MFYEPFWRKIYPQLDDFQNDYTETPAKPIYGYKAISTDGTYLKDKHESKIVRYIFDLMLKNNLPAFEIAKLATKEIFEISGGQEEHNFYSSTVIRIIRKPEYCCYFYSNGKLSVSRLYRDPIVTLKEWEEAVRILEHRIKYGHGRKSQLSHPLSGFMICEQCHLPYHHKQRKRINPDKTSNLTKDNTLAGFFQHSPYKDDQKCKTDPTVNAPNIEKLTAMLFLKTITNREYRKELIRAYAHYEYNSQSRYNNLGLLHDDFNLKSYISRIKNFTDAPPNALASQIENIIQSDFTSTQWLISRFNTFMESALKKWVINKDADRFMILRTFFDQILVGKDSITYIFETQKKVHVNYKNLPEKWQDEVKRLGKTKFIQDQIPKIDDDLDQLISYLDEITIQQYYLNEYEETSKSNQLQHLFFESHKIPYKHLYERADFIDCEDIKSRLNALLPYQINHKRSFFVDIERERQEITVVHDTDTVLSMTRKGKRYINSRYIHRLPEWFYGANFEYFKVGNDRIAFIIEEEKVKAYKLPTRGGRKEMNIEEAFSLLESEETYDYRDID